MDMEFVTLRKQLDDLGYRDKFSIDSLPLIRKLTADLMHTSRSLQHYMNLAKETLKERDDLKYVAEPYICDNAKLVKKNMQLHRELDELKEKFEGCKSESKRKIKDLGNELLNLEFEHRHLKMRCRDQELKNLCADTFSSRSKQVLNPNRPCCSQSLKSTSSSKKCMCAQKSCSNCLDLECQMECLQKNTDKYKEQNSKLLDDVAFLSCQIKNRDTENSRLSKLLEGGRPLSALQKDCCGKDLDKKLTEAYDELQESETQIDNLNTQLKDAIDKQHEAMNRALQLADKNSSLENELRNIDRLALKIECECNEQLKDKCTTILHLEKQLNAVKDKNIKLERDIASSKENEQVLKAELEANKNENEALNVALMSCSDAKEKLLKEKELLLKANRDREIALKSHGFRNTLTEDCTSRNRNSERSQSTNICNCCNEDKETKKELLALLEKERKLYESQINEVKKQLSEVNTFECRFMKGNHECLEKLRQERDFYYNRSIAKHPSEEFLAELKVKNCELEQQVQYFKKQNEVLLENNNSLKLLTNRLKNSQIKTTVSPDFEMESYMQITINKLERELKRAQEVIRSLEEERNMLRCKLIVTTTNQRDDIDNRKSPSHSRNYGNHSERNCSMVENLTKERNDLAEKLKIVETELLHVKSLNNQLKTLQLQNDKNIADSQAHSYEFKRELRELREKVNLLEKNKTDLEFECQGLRSEKNALRNGVRDIDEARDKLIIDIDNKTERLSTMEHELRSKETSNDMLENKIKELNKKINLLTSSNASVEHKIRDSQTRSDALSIELQTVIKQRDNALIENKRLQSDLATLNNDMRALTREYDESRKEVEQMKQQLQHYVDEVRRIEDILYQKEAERTEMLDHFASLSHEATVLENNNHSLESEAANKNIQLQASTDKLNELQKKLESREALIDMQEEKMTTLIYKISKLECELEQQKELTLAAEKNLEYARHTCASLEKQKKSILMGMGETDSEKKKLEYHLRSLNEEKNKIEDNYAKDRATVESLESLLNTSRREVVDLKLQLQESLEETKYLKEKVEQLQNRLQRVEGESISSRQRSEEAAKNLQELQWQMTDQRFQRTRTSQQASTSKYYSGGTL